MTIKQQGGIFGRNPTFNDVDVNTLDVTGAASVGNDLTVEETVNINSASASGAAAILKNTADVSRLLLISSSDGFIIRSNNSASGAVKKDTIFQQGTAESARFNTSGNLAFPSGQGIDFSATSGTGTSELFDDYEEGNFTATLNATSGSFTLNAALNSMSYTKIGRMVFITGMIAISSSTATGTFFELESLPFPAADLGETSGRSAGMASLDSIGGVGVIGKILETNTKMRFTIDASTVTGNIYFNLNYVAA
tara:strand:+ start:1500 stop:2255 length:756 start_codon:yes stop_codon:yes gene_type:complete